MWSISLWSLEFVSENFDPYWWFCSLHCAVTFSFRLVMKQLRLHCNSEATGKMQIGVTDLDHVFTSCDSVILLLICVEQTVHTSSSFPNHYKKMWQIDCLLMCTWSFINFQVIWLLLRHQFMSCCSCGQILCSWWIIIKVLISISESFKLLKACTQDRASYL